MNDCKILELIFETKLPKYKEDYEQEIILHIVGMCFILFLIPYGWKNTDLDRLFAFMFGLISVFIFYEKFYQYIIVDAIGLDKDHIHMMKNEAYIYSAKLDNLGIKINSDRNGGLNRTFYDISTNKRLFNFRDKDIGEKESEIFMEKLALHIGCEKNVFSELT